MGTKRRKGPKRPSEVLAEQVALWRTKRGLTVEQLADRIAALGGRMERVTLTKLENRQRGVSLDEALLLAAALNVPPALLIFPLESGEHVAVTPKSVIHPDLASGWLAGVGPLATTERFAHGLQEWTDAARPLRLYETLNDAQSATEAAEGQVRRADYSGDETALRKARARFAQQLANLGEVLEEMRVQGIKPPKMPQTWTDTMRELGIEGGD